MFRLLKENEIDVRVQSVTEKGCVLLLYKDARVDMNILDETVGPMKWKRNHTRDNANCIVSIWNDDIKQWIDKEDTGTESNTEKEKGQASDSFKRACTNWGIGRELYTAGFLFAPADKCTIYDTKRKDRNDKPIYATYDKFKVEKIKYDDNNEIVNIAIKNQKNERVFVK